MQLLEIRYFRVVSGQREAFLKTGEMRTCHLAGLLCTVLSSPRDFFVVANKHTENRVRFCQVNVGVCLRSKYLVGIIDRYNKKGQSSVGSFEAGGNGGSPKRQVRGKSPIAESQACFRGIALLWTHHLDF